MKHAYEYIVVGCGGLGSAAAYRLAREAGSEVLALEQFGLGHDNGASQDHSRIIRLSYHDPTYTALTPHTYTAWGEVEEESGVQLVVKTGGLDLAAPGSETIGNYAAAMTTAGFPFEDLSAEEAMRRWPQWRLDDGDRVLYQADAGLVDARKANAVHIALARGYGAMVQDTSPVREIRANESGIAVVTDDAIYQAGTLVVAADAWTNQVLAGVGFSMPLTITQEQVTFWATPHLRQFAPDRFPIWIWHGEDYYGFPVYGEVATKAGVDVGGQEVTTETRTFEKDRAANERLVGFLENRLPGYVGPELYTKSCLYTMPPDRNFTIDVVPGYPRIVFAQGAAHAFKFAALIGQILTDLAVRGETRYPIEPFSATRAALSDPAYELALHM
ncbi:MAG: N-methyl-L-tryptophan oxidase [Chloroflexi bacterium]|nr:N-methyl-L-tryptophan oxidase [Chloroflexota bacterium]